MELPPQRGSYSYETVSPDHRYYAVSVRPPEGGPSNVHVLDPQTDEWSVLLDKPGYHAKHEQFSRDGRNRVLIQLNQMPDVEVVLLSELEIGGTEKRFPADQPYTLHPTGHEAWIGTTSSIFFSTALDPVVNGNVWRATVGNDQPTLVYEGKRFGHVSVSRDGKYWIGDTGEQGVPIYIGSFASGRCRRAAKGLSASVWSKTEKRMVGEPVSRFAGDFCQHPGRSRMHRPFRTDTNASEHSQRYARFGGNLTGGRRVASPGYPSNPVAAMATEPQGLAPLVLLGKIDWLFVICAVRVT